MLSGVIVFVVGDRPATEKATIRTALPQHLNHGSQLSEVVMPRGIFTRKSHIARFWTKVDKTSSCWNWIGSDTGRGYGSFWDGNKCVRAHRWSYERFVGQIPGGLTIDHLCRNTLCVNPKHLEPVTQWENMMRGNSIQAKNARKTHCKRGHEFTEANTHIQIGKNGSRQRTCIKCRTRWFLRLKLRTAKNNKPRLDMAIE